MDFLLDKYWIYTILVISAFLIVLLLRRTIKKALNDYIYFDLEQNGYKMISYKVLFFSTGNFYFPSYYWLIPSKVMKNIFNAIYLNITIEGKDKVTKVITAKIKMSITDIDEVEYKTL